MKSPLALLRALSLALVVAATACSSAVNGQDGGDALAPVDAAQPSDSIAPTDSAVATCAVTPGDAGAFPSFDRTCAGDTDCTLVRHLNSCCGDTRYMGIVNGCAAAFANEEAAWELAHPAACGCARPDSTETGVEGVAPQAVSVHCVAGRCAALASVECGNTRCAPGQACRTEGCGGPACGQCPATPACVDVPSACVLATSCDCLRALCGSSTCGPRVVDGVTCTCP